MNYFSRYSHSDSFCLKKISIHNCTMDVESNVQWTIQPSQIFDRSRHLSTILYKINYYLETGVSKVSLGAWLLQICLQIAAKLSGTYQGVPDSCMLRPIAFGSKSLSTTETRYSNIERDTLAILQEVSISYNWSQTTHCYFSAGRGYNDPANSRSADHYDLLLSCGSQISRWHGWNA